MSSTEAVVAFARTQLLTHLAGLESYLPPNVDFRAFVSGVVHEALFMQGTTDAGMMVTSPLAAYSLDMEDDEQDELAAQFDGQVAKPSTATAHKKKKNGGDVATPPAREVQVPGTKSSLSKKGLK